VTSFVYWAVLFIYGRSFAHAHQELGQVCPTWRSVLYITDRQDIPATTVNRSRSLGYVSLRVIILDKFWQWLSNSRDFSLSLPCRCGLWSPGMLRGVGWCWLPTFSKTSFQSPRISPEGEMYMLSESVVTNCKHTLLRIPEKQKHREMCLGIGQKCCWHSWRHLLNRFHGCNLDL